MRILLVNRFYGGEQTPTGRMLEDVANCLVQRGHAVRVLASKQKYAGIQAPFNGDGRVHVQAVRTGPGSSRLVHWAGFWLRAVVTTPFTAWDRCVMLTDPPFMLLAAPFRHWLRGRSRKLFWWTMDLYPEAMIAKGMIQPDGAPARLLHWLNDLGLRHLAGVIALGPTQRRLLTRYRNFDDSAEACRVVPPWDLRRLPRIEPEQNRFLARFGWRDRKIALYAGNLGEAHSFQNLLAAAARMAAQGADDWLFVFVARGAQRAALERAAATVLNVVILDYQPPELTADLLNAATVHVVTMKHGWEGIIVPSKLYGIAATGIPVLFIGPRDADTAIEIDTHKLGACIDSDADADEVAKLLKQLAMRPRAEASEMPTDGPQRIAEFITA